MAERNGRGERPPWRRRSIVASLPSLALAPATWSAHPNRPVEPLRVVLDAPLGRPAEHAWNELTKALRKKGLERLTQSEAPAAREPALIVGIARASAADGAATTGLQPGLPPGPEALVVKNLSVKPWEDPDYAARFARSCRLGADEGFEVVAPLSNRGFGNDSGRWSILSGPPASSYRWEHQRYWYFYLLFGRMGYNPACKPAEPSRAMTVFVAI